MNKLINWFYTTALGGLYFEFLLWLDRRNDRPTRFLSPKEMAQIIRESNKTYDGVAKIKNKVNSLVQSRSTEEYHKILCEIEDLAGLAYNDENSDQAKFTELLRNMYVKHKTHDIVTVTDRAKMIDQRIQDTKEMWDHQAKRQLLRDIRKAGEAGDTQLLNKLQMEFKNKYGRTDSRLRKS